MANSIFYILGRELIIVFGDIVKIKGKYVKPQGQRNYKGFDYSSYLKSKKIFGSIRADKAEKVGVNNSIYFKYLGQVYKLKSTIIVRIENNIDNTNSQVLNAVLVGDKTSLEKEIKDSFRISNLSHMLAISGAHFGFLIMFCTFVIKRLKFKRFGQAITITLIIFFMTLTGMTPSVVRAGIMAIISILSSILKRKTDIYTSLAVALFIQIINNPYVIFDVGLQLSFGGVVGISLFTKPIEEKLNRIKELKINSSLAVTLGANIIIMPIMMYQFSTISLSFVISNLIAGSLLGAIMILGFVSVILNIKPLYFVLNLLVSLFSKIADICSKLPLSLIYVKTPSLIQIFLIYFIIFLFYLILIERLNLFSIKQLFISLLIIIFILNYRIPNNNLIIHFIDVGQGDSCLILHKGYVIMIDGGGSTDSKYDIGENTLLPYLLDRKITKIDYLIVSHFDSDHAQGFIYVLKHLKIKNAILPVQAINSNLYQNFISICQAKKINVIYLRRGDLFNIGYLKFETLHPSNKFISENAMNNNSLVLRLDFFNTSILFTGDIEAIAEQELVHKCKSKLDVDILKVGHHGSNTSTSESFLEAVSPKIALIGVGLDNKFGHPGEEVIKRLEERKVSIFRTDKESEITMEIYRSGNLKHKTNCN